MMDLETLKLVAIELDKSLRGGFINKIHQPLPREIVLRVRLKGARQMKLILSADPKLGRIHLTQLKIPSPQNPPRFCAYLRAHFQGSIIDSISVADDDRVVTIKCYKKTADSIVRRLFILELLGRDSNMLLVDEESNTIMDCLLSIPQKETATRVVLPGICYAPPPKRAQQRLTTGMSLGSPIMRPALGLSDQDSREFRSHTVSDKDERLGSINEAVDSIYSEMISRMILENLRKTYMAPVKTRIASLKRRMEKIAQDKQRLATLASGLELGELLKANLHRVAKGMARLEVLDWEGQRKVSIPLDPSIDGVTNMQRIFAKATKGKRGLAIVDQRMEDTLAEKRALEDILVLLEQSESLEEISAVLDGTFISPTNVPESLEKRSSASTKKRESSPDFSRYASDSGLEILVGRTGRGNDTILRNKAQKGDLWFHVKDAPGAHVVLKVGSDRRATPKDVEKAASLAGYFSALRTAGKGEIMVADVKDVRPISGGPPGKVRVTKYETLVAKWSPQG